MSDYNGAEGVQNTGGPTDCRIRTGWKLMLDEHRPARPYFPPSHRTPAHELELMNPKCVLPKFERIWFPVLDSEVDDE